MHIVLFGAFKSVINAANELGIRLTIIDKVQLVDTSLLQPNHQFILLDYHQKDLAKNIIAAITQSQKVDMILSFTEPALLLASQIAEELGIATPFSSEVVKNTKDKQRMRQKLADSPHTIAHQLACDAKQAAAFVKEQNRAVIIKPVDGVGSESVVCVTPDNLNALHRLDFTNQEYLCEEFVHGQEFSVECFSFAGRHKLLSVHQKFKTGAEYPNPFVEIGHIGPADLTPQTWQLIETAVFDCLDRMGICDGPSHTEVILTDTEVKIVETHTRVGGDRIFHLLKLSTGIDIFRLSLQWFCQKTGYIGTISRKGVAAVYFFHAPQGHHQPNHRR